MYQIGTSTAFSVLNEWFIPASLAAAFGAGSTVAKFFIRKLTDRASTTPTANIRFDQEVGRLLREVRIVCKANRAFLAKFRGDNKFSPDEEEYRWTHEDTDTASSSAASRFYNVCASLVPEEMELVREPGPSYKVVADLPDKTFKHMLIETGTDAIARCAVRDSSGQPRHFIGLDFIRNTTKPENISELTVFAARMERLLAHGSVRSRS